MNRDQPLHTEARAELVRTASAILDGKIKVLDGIRTIVALCYELNDPEHGPNSSLFITFIGAESQTDHLPSGKVRDLCAAEYLKKVDEEAQRFFSDAKDWLFPACREIIRLYGPRERPTGRGL